MTTRRILVVYYTQTGQMRKILEHVAAPLTQAGHEVVFAPIVPEHDFPFPWSSEVFFDAFPESFMGIPVPLKPLSEAVTGNFDLVIFGYSTWYLSPSIPAASFLQSEEAKTLLRDKPVITVIGCRNMWLMSQEKIKKYLQTAGARLIGNIALVDRAPNLTSVLTIIRWMMKGQQEAGRCLPVAGVAAEDIEHSSVFGEMIGKRCEEGNYSDMQDELNAAGAVNVKSNLLLFERNGSKIFRMWASKILKKGPAGDPRRRGVLRFFKWYLLAVLFVVSPVGTAVYSVIKLFIGGKLKRDREYFSHNALAEKN
jgi:flavodoxin